MLQKMGIPITVATLSEPTRQLTEWRAKWRRRWVAPRLRSALILSPPSRSFVRWRRPLHGHARRPSTPRTRHSVDLPNGRILFSTAPAILAAITGCSVVPVTVRRTPGGLYHLVAQPAVEVRPGSREERKAEIERCTRSSPHPFSPSLPRPAPMVSIRPRRL